MCGEGHSQGMAVAGEPAYRLRCQRRDLGIWHGGIAGPQHLDRAERDAAGELAEVFAIGRLQHQAFKFAELPCRLQALGPVQQLTQGGDIGGEPGETMRGELLALQQVRIDRKSVVSGKSVSVRVDTGGRRTLKNNNKNTNITQRTVIAKTK